MANEEKSRKWRYLLFMVGAMMVAFILGVEEFINADTWVNGTNYIYPNSSYSNNVHFTGNTSGIYVHNLRLDGNGYNHVNRSMKGNGTYIHYPREQ